MIRHHVQNIKQQPQPTIFKVADCGGTRIYSRKISAWIAAGEKIRLRALVGMIDHVVDDVENGTQVDQEKNTTGAARMGVLFVTYQHSDTYRSKERGKRSTAVIVPPAFYQNLHAALRCP